MKYVTLILTLAVMLSSLSAQTTLTAQQWFETNPDALTPEQIIAKLSAPSGKMPNNTVAQVRDEKIFVIVGSDSFVRRGRSLQTQLAAIKQFGEPLTIFGRILVPGPSGKYDEKGRVAYFNAPTGVLFGRLPRGVVQNETVELYSPRIADDSEYGEYIMEVSVILEGGVTIQRLYTRYYVSWAGPDGRWYSLDRGRLEGTTTQKILRLEGAFPLNSPLLVFFGRTGYGLEPMQAHSTDGQTVSIPVQLGTGRDQELDAVVMLPGVGECMTVRVIAKADPRQ